MQQNSTTSRNGALDGLRLLSIIAIIIYHLNLPWLPSGHMGVVIFLVLSGYLATNAVARRFDQQGKVSFGTILRTWIRRLVRMWPSIIALVVIVGTLCGTLDHVLFTKMRPDVFPSLGFFLNLSYIVRDVSYFDLIGGTSPLLHLWYLGCDLQFFLVWTLLLSLLLKRGRAFARRSAAILAVASAAWMAWLFVPGGDPSRIYYGTDTRAFSLLLGSWLALAFPLGADPLVCKRLFIAKRNEEKYGPGATRATVWAHLLGIASLAGIVSAMILIPSDSPMWYQGGMFAFSLLVVVLVATLLAPTTIVGFLLGLPPMRTLGLRAFSLYLWHYPIFLLFSANKNTTDWSVRAAAIIVSIIAAELSLRLVERPFSHAGLAYAARNSEEDEEAKEPTTLQRSITALSSLAMIACGIYTSYALDRIPDTSLIPENVLVSTGTSAGQAMDLSKDREEKQQQQQEQQQEKPAPEQNTPQEVTEQKQETKQVEVTANTILSAPESEVAAGKYDPVLIGDSVPGDAGNEFVAGGMGWQKRLPNALIDTFIGRSPYQALEVLKGYLDQGVVGKVIVMACFSNSTPYPETLDAMIEAAGPEREIYLVGTVNPDGFQDAANANLQQAAEAHDNVHYVDWPAVLNGHMEQYLWADATHLRPEGAGPYVDMVVHAIAQAIVDAGGSATEAS